MNDWLTAHMAEVLILTPLVYLLLSLLFSVAIGRAAHLGDVREGAECDG